MIKYLTSLPFKRVIIGCTILWSLCFLYLPYLSLLEKSLVWVSPDGIVLSGSAYGSILNRDFFRLCFKSVRISALASFICLWIAYPMAWSLSQIKQIKTKIYLLFLGALPFWTSSLLRLYRLRVLLGRNGFLNRLIHLLAWNSNPIQFLYGDGAIITGLVYLLLPFMLLPLYSSMSRIDPAQIEAAHDLGAAGYQIFYYIVLPQTFPGVLTGLFMVFLPGLTLFYVSDILGGGKYVLLGNWIKTSSLVLQKTQLCAAACVSLLVILNAVIYVCHRLVLSEKARKIASC